MPVQMLFQRISHRESVLHMLHPRAFEAVPMLVAAGCPVNRTDSCDATALSSACRREGAAPLVRSLIAAGADVNIPTASWVTPLHFATRAGNVENVTTLLNAGANVDASNEISDTALHMACEANNLQIVELLCHFGADMNGLSDHGPALSPLCGAFYYGHTSITRYLCDNGASLALSRMIACGVPSSTGADVCKQLLLAGADVSEMQPLRKLQYYDEPAVVALLLSSWYQFYSGSAKVSRLRGRRCHCSLDCLIA
jgi:ankyrin repeat protein